MTSSEHPWEQIHRKKEWSSKEPFPRFFEVVQSFKGNGCVRILDLGCGNGRHLYQFAKEGFDVTGMDISISGLHSAQEWIQKGNLRSTFLQADMRSHFPIREAAYDGVFSTQVIHHALIVDIRRTIREIYRVLRVGGLAFITVSGRVDQGIGHEQIEKGTYIPLSGSEKGLPHHIFNEDELRDEFQDFQLEELSSRAGGKILAVLVRKPTRGS
jgi:SAM-dependent methyltransferase